jgi:pre-mRNA-splicing factor ATP-dependent RNA helicase DHX15/PRP43
MMDKSLSKYSYVFIDEAHEWTLNTDILIGTLKDLVKQRAKTESPLRLILMSATIEIEKFVKYFDNQAPVLSIKGRMYPVEIFHLP